MPKVTVNGVDRSTSYTPTQMAALQIRQIAFDGEVGQGTLPLPDPAGTYETYAGEPVLIEDGAETILEGFVGSLQRDRGEGAVGPRRAVSHVLGDENGRLYGFRAYRWERPAESTRARFLAFLAAFVPGLDTTWVLNTHTATMPKKSYTTESLFDELKAEIFDLTGNTAFIEGGRAHLHLPTEGIISTIALTDVAWDWINTFPAEADSSSRDKDPHDLGNDILVKGPGGTSRVTDATSIARHDVAGIKHQRILNVDDKGSTKRLAKGNATLGETKDERVTYECNIGPLTAAQVNEIPPGCLMSVTDQVMGLTAATQRLAARTLTYKHHGHWYAHLEFGFPVRIRMRPPRIPVPAPFIPEILCLGGAYPITPSRSFVPYGSPGTADADGLVWYGASTGTYEPHPGLAQTWGFPIFGPPDFAGDCTSSTLNFVVVGPGRLVVQTVEWGTAPFSPRGMSWSLSHDSPGGVVVDASVASFAAGEQIAIDVPYHADATDCVHQIVFADGGGACGGKWGWSGATWVSMPVASNAPDPGQRVTESGTGAAAGTTFTTNYPYQENSLEVHVGGIVVVPTQTDPDAGTYTLPIDSTGLQVLVTYRASDATPTGALNQTPDAIVPIIPLEVLPPGIVPEDLGDLVDVDTAGELGGLGLFFDGTTWRPAWAPEPLLLEDDSLAVLENGHVAMSEPEYA